MKYCSNCKKAYQDNASYCGICGSPLERIEFDIFGEPMHVSANPNPSATYYNRKPIDPESRASRTIMVSEAMALISIGAMFVPLYGSIVCLVAMITNGRTVKTYKKNVGYLILSIITLIISLYFLYLLVASGTLIEMTSGAIES